MIANSIDYQQYIFLVCKTSSPFFYSTVKIRGDLCYHNVEIFRIWGRVMFRHLKVEVLKYGCEEQK